MKKNIINKKMIQEIKPCGLILQCRICKSVNDYKYSYCYKNNLFHTCDKHKNDVKKIFDEFVQQNIILNIKKIFEYNIIPKTFNFTIRRSNGVIENGWFLSEYHHISSIDYYQYVNNKWLICFILFIFNKIKICHNLQKEILLSTFLFPNWEFRLIKKGYILSKPCFFNNFVKYNRNLKYLNFMLLKNKKKLSSF